MYSIVNKKSKIMEIFIALSSLLYIIDVLLISKIGQNLNLRIQDIASVLSTISLIYILKKYKEKFSCIFLNIFIFFIYVTVDNLILYTNGSTDGKFIFYIGKEIEYILCMFTMFYYIKNHFKTFYNILDILICINILFGFYQVIAQNMSYYGIGTIFEKSPSVSGAIYFFCSISCFFMYKKFGENRFKVYSLLTYILVVFTISKTNILGLTMFYILYYIIEFFHKININIKNRRSGDYLIKSKNIFFIMIFLIVLIVFIIVLLNSRITNNILNNKLIGKVFYRFKLLSDSYSFRKNKAKFYYDYFIGDSVLSLLFGCGKGITEFTFDVNTLGVDNQFVRSIIELGLVGIILWLNVIFSIINFIRKSGAYINYCFIISLFISYLCMGVGYEAFVVTKSGIIFWFLIGIFMSHIDFNRDLSSHMKGSE